MKKLITYTFVLLFIAGVAVSCDNFLEPSLDQNKTVDNAINSAGDFQSAVNSSINAMSAIGYYGRDFPVSFAAESDNAYSINTSNRFVTQTRLNYTVNNGFVSDLWSGAYGAISDINLALKQEDLGDSKAINDIRGQAYALRAVNHLNLVASYGEQWLSDGGPSSMGVPYVTTYKKEDNLYPSRPPVSEDWGNIGDDFSNAVSNLQKNSDFDPTLMNYWAARGLQSRYALYSENWELVKTAAKDVIDNGPFHITSAENLGAAWRSDTKPQPLFEIDYSPTDHNRIDNIANIYFKTIEGTPVYGDVVASTELYNSYDSGDVRLDLISTPAQSSDGNYRMTGKYVNISGNDNVVVIRYAEVVLNYAEALARTGEKSQALTWLNKLASNRNEPAYSSASIANILKERRKELAMEGLRFFDLARTGQGLPVIQGSLRSDPIPAGSFHFALPIPDNEIRANSNITQNQGYQ